MPMSILIAKKKLIKNTLYWLAGTASFFFLMRFLYGPVYQEGDTVALIHETDGIIASVSKGRWTGWGGQFPLLQKIPVLAMKYFGWSDPEIIHGLGVLSLASFALILFWNWRSLSCYCGFRRLSWLFLAVLLSSPLLWYGNSTFGEMLAAMVTCGFVIACREKAPPWKIFLFFLLASISKDTAFLFLFILGFVASAERRPSEKFFPFGFPRWRLLSVSALSGMAASFVFNYLKFGSVLNLVYLNPLFIVHSIAIQMSFFLGVWFSPNGGILFYWFSFFLLLVLAGLAAFSDEKGWREALPFLAVILVLAGLTWGFSKWYAPLGWICWGPRLLLPWCPATGYVLLAFYGRGIENILATILRGGKILLVSYLFVLAAMPQFIVLFHKNTLGRFFFSFDDVCPRLAIIQEDTPYYYKCMDHDLWHRKSMIIDLLSRSMSPMTWIFALAYGALLTSLLYLASGQEFF